MNSHLLHCCLEAWGLYAPKDHESASEDVLCADGVGIGRVTALHTQKHLSSPIQLVAPATDGARPGGVARLNADRQHTVFLRLVCESLDHPPIRPRCDGLPKGLSAASLLAASTP